MQGYIRPSEEIERIKYCRKCHKIKSVHRKEHCTCPKPKEELKG